MSSGWRNDTRAPLDSDHDGETTMMEREHNQADVCSPIRLNGGPKDESNQKESSLPKLATIFYGSLGIPLLFLTLNRTGNQLAHSGLNCLIILRHYCFSLPVHYLCCSCNLFACLRLLSWLCCCCCCSYLCCLRSSKRKCCDSNNNKAPKLKLRPRRSKSGSTSTSNNNNQQQHQQQPMRMNSPYVIGFSLLTQVAHVPGDLHHHQQQHQKSVRFVGQQQQQQQQHESVPLTNESIRFDNDNADYKLANEAEAEAEAEKRLHELDNSQNFYSPGLLATSLAILGAYLALGAHYYSRSLQTPLIDALYSCYSLLTTSKLPDSFDVDGHMKSATDRRTIELLHSIVATTTSRLQVGQDHSQATTTQFESEQSPSLATLIGDSVYLLVGLNLISACGHFARLWMAGEARRRLGAKCPSSRISSSGQLTGGGGGAKLADGQLGAGHTGSQPPPAPLVRSLVGSLGQCQAELVGYVGSARPVAHLGANYTSEQQLGGGSAASDMGAQSDNCSLERPAGAGQQQRLLNGQQQQLLNEQQQLNLAELFVLDSGEQHAGAAAALLQVAPDASSFASSDHSTDRRSLCSHHQAQIQQSPSAPATATLDRRHRHHHDHNDHHQHHNHNHNHNHRHQNHHQLVQQHQQAMLLMGGRQDQSQRQARLHLVGGADDATCDTPLDGGAGPLLNSDPASQLLAAGGATTSTSAAAGPMILRLRSSSSSTQLSSAGGSGGGGGCSQQLVNNGQGLHLHPQQAYGTTTSSSSSTQPPHQQSGAQMAPGGRQQMLVRGDASGDFMTNGFAASHCNGGGAAHADLTSPATTNERELSSLNNTFNDTNSQTMSSISSNRTTATNIYTNNNQLIKNWQTNGANAAHGKQFAAGRYVMPAASGLGGGTAGYACDQSADDEPHI